MSQKFLKILLVFVGLGLVSTALAISFEIAPQSEPTVENINLSIDSDLVTISAKVTDVSGVYAVGAIIKNSQGSEVARVTLDRGPDNIFKKTIDSAGYPSGQYTVDIFALDWLANRADLSNVKDFQAWGKLLDSTIFYKIDQMGNQDGILNMADYTSTAQSVESMLSSHTQANIISKTIARNEGTAVQPIDYLCPDVKQDGKINVLDITYFEIKMTEPYSGKYDLDLDGGIDESDLSIIIYDIAYGKKVSDIPTCMDIQNVQISPNSGFIGTLFIMTARITAASGISISNPPVAHIKRSGTEINQTILYDDGNHGDGAANDSIYGTVWNSSGYADGPYTVDVSAENTLGNLLKVIDIASFDLGFGVNCRKVIGSGDPMDKIDVVFFPDGFMTEEELNTFKNNLLPSHIGIVPGNDGILSLEPFTSKSNKFNFYYVHEFNDLGCDNRYNMCWNNVRPIVSENCPMYDEIIVLTKPWSGYAITGGHFAVATADLTTFILKGSMITVHEFGHGFGGLKDEYSSLRPISPVTYPNCDVYGCPKWCSGTPSRPEPPWQKCSAITDAIKCDNDADCEWWSSQAYSAQCVLSNYNYGNFSEGLSCIEGAECWHNCIGTNGFRSFISSRMAGDYGLSSRNQFNTVSKNHISNIFNCCYPESIEEFQSVECIQWNKNNQHRYESCTTYE